MVITLPYGVADFWETFKLLDGSSEFELLDYSQQSMDGGQNFIGAKLAEGKWIADVNVVPLYDADAKKIEAKIDILRGRDGAFLAYDKRRKYPASDPTGSKLANGSVVSIGGEAAFADVNLGTYRYEGSAVTLAQAATITSDAGTYFDAEGVLQTQSANVARVDYGPFANYIRNFKAAGAAVGTPGTAPTNWTVSNSGGLSSAIVGTGTESGIPYVDIRFYGTASGAGAWFIVPEVAAIVKTRLSQQWASSFALKLVAGSFPGALNIALAEYNSSSAYLGETQTPITVDSALARKTHAGTTGQAAVASVVPSLAGAFTNGQVVDFTIRVGAPLLNRGAVALTYPRVPYFRVDTAAANKLVRSREFDNASWVKGNVSVTANTSAVVDPWGTQLADKVVESSASSVQHTLHQVYTTSNYVNHVVYVLAKAGERSRFLLSLSNFSTANCNAEFDLIAGTAGTAISGTGDFTGASATITALGNGWFWCELEALKTSGDSDCYPQLILLDTAGASTYTGDGTSGLYLAHSQLEEGVVGHLPIVTTTAGIARAADGVQLHGRGINDWQLVYFNGVVHPANDLSGDWGFNGSGINYPLIKSWGAVRDTQPAAAAVQIKSKGSNNRSVALKGLPPFYALKAGERLSISNGSTLIGLFEISEDVTADYLGETVEFEMQPYLPTWIAVDQAVTLAKAPGKFKILRGSYKRGSIEARRTVGKSFQIISVY